jgi:hypothetical protein
MQTPHRLRWQVRASEHATNATGELVHCHSTSVLDLTFDNVGKRRNVRILCNTFCHLKRLAAEGAL